MRKKPTMSPDGLESNNLKRLKNNGPHADDYFHDILIASLN